MNSFFSNLISWAKNSPAVQAAKAEAVKDLTQAAENFMASVAKNSPDFVAQVESQMASAVSTAIAGALTRSK